MCTLGIYFECQIVTHAHDHVSKRSVLSPGFDFQQIPKKNPKCRRPRNPSLQLKRVYVVDCIRCNYEPISYHLLGVGSERDPQRENTIVGNVIVVSKEDERKIY